MAKLPDLSQQKYDAPKVIGSKLADYSQQALDLMQYARRNFYGKNWLMQRLYNLDALELSVITDLIADGHGFVSISRDPNAYNAQVDTALAFLDEKAEPLGLHYPRGQHKWPGRPGLLTILAMLKEGR